MNVQPRDIRSLLTIELESFVVTSQLSLIDLFGNQFSIEETD